MDDVTVLFAHLATLLPVDPINPDPAHPAEGSAARDFRGHRAQRSYLPHQEIVQTADPFPDVVHPSDVRDVRDSRRSMVHAVIQGPLSRALVCPTCLERFGRADLKWHDEDGESHQPPPRQLGFRERVSLALSGERHPAPTAADVANWMAMGLKPTCPNGDRLPPEMTQRDTFVIGLVGEKGASKSTYIASMIKELTSGLMTRYGVLIQLDADSAQRYRGIYGPLHNDHDHPILEGTQAIGGFTDAMGAGREPLVLEVRDRVTQRAVNVLIYDAAGEQLLSATHHARYNRFLLEADAVLLFVPPPVLPALQRQIPDPAQTQEVTEAMFGELASAMRQARQLRDFDDLPVHAAVLLCKVDEVAQITDFDSELLEGVPFAMMTAKTAVDRIQSDSQRVADFMTRMGAVNLVANIADRFIDPTFHAVSATGCEAEDGAFPFLHPTGCLEPMFAILARSGMISLEDPHDGF